MFSEDELLPLAGLRQLVYCERRWALMFLENLWADNRFTVEGRILHENVDRSRTEVRGNVRIAYGLRLRSLRLGLVGRADVVEFHPSEDVSKHGEGLSPPPFSDMWKAIPVEYKRGRPSPEHGDEVQLCAQALCLEEMIGLKVSYAMLYYGRTRRRIEVSLSADLRKKTETLAMRLHELYAARHIPPAVPDKKCKGCSLVDICLPEATRQGKKVEQYLRAAFDFLQQERMP